MTRFTQCLKAISFSAAIGFCLITPSNATQIAPSQPVAIPSLAQSTMFQSLQGNGSFQNFSLKLKDGTLKAENFAFVGLSSSDDLFTAESFEMQKVVITRGTETTTIDSILLKNVALSAPENASDGLAILQAVANSSADSAVISNVKLSTPEGSATVAELKLENLKTGVVGLLSLNDGAIATNDGSASVRSFKTNNVNVGKVLNIVDSAKYGAARDASVSELMSALEITELNFAGSDSKTTFAMKLDALKMGAISGKQMLHKPSDIIATFTGLQSRVEDPRLQAYFEWAMVVISEAISVQDIALTNASLEVSETGKAMQASFENISIGAGNLVDLAPFSLSGFKGTFNEKMKVDFALAALSVGDGHFFSPESLQAFQTEKPDANGYIAFAKAHRRNYFENTKLANMSVAVNDQSLISMPELNATSSVDGALWSSLFNMPSLTVDMDTVVALGAPKPIIDKLGYTQLDFALEGVSSLDTSAQIVALDKMQLTLKDGGALNFTAKMGNIKDEFLGTLLPNEQAENLLQASIIGADLTFTDNSLIKRILEVGAMLTGSTPEAMQAQAVAGASFFALQLGDPKVAQQVSKALSTFLEKPENLSIRLTPPEPVVIGTLQASAQQGPAALIKVLGAEMLANQ